jgi:hypothetical protein
MDLLAAPFLVDGERPAERCPAPRQGEHTREVLAGAGIADIEGLFARGVIAE